MVRGGKELGDYDSNKNWVQKKIEFKVLDRDKGES